MRILIIAPEQIPVPPILGGSVEIAILALAGRLARQHEVTVVSRTHKRYPAYSEIDGVSIRRVPGGRPSKYLTHVLRWLKSQSTRFDLIQIDNRPRFVEPVKRLCPHIPVSLFLQSLTFVSQPYMDSDHAAYCLSKADLIMANSASLKQQLISRFPSISDIISKAWLGVDTDRFSPGPPRVRRGPFTLLFVGRIIPRKGLPILLHAIKRAQVQTDRKIKVIIAGHSVLPGYIRQMKRLKRSLGISAVFLGVVPHSRIHRIYRLADALVCPSQKHEAFGLVNVEAMSSGLPVIASRNGGIGEIVSHMRNGLLVDDYHRPDSFAVAIAELMKDRALYNRLRLQARMDALSTFSWEASADHLSRIYTQYVENAR
ncbi:glycosyltransferase [Paenibacillus darwinianus]|uniref:Glycosyltransferase n=1 Tax=Paenibacillus darwinianus TaxID=1380763 RepID=A0A9W5S286_9BACL|nr:glycosyltransferase family 4 protein [Paenibacillus darwinianus]EXX85427.1 glycosyltransferase [Paenibacillus darwinianus]EXX89308.1 glycosyltransferase [Paenibacillus darwinianus]EXX90050.1 glycosyltransferase [Paenibacillus darwinianus]